MNTELNKAQVQMNDQYQQTMTKLLNNAQHDALLARSAKDAPAIAKAQARMETLEAALKQLT